jgi:hypothetical protein
MSYQNSLKDKEEGKLLTPQERQACQQISTGEAPHSQRAQALLALDEGATQTQAGQQAGLTRSQVKYWLGKFLREGLDAFPEGVYMEAPAAPTGPENVGPEEVEVAVESAQEDQTAKKSKLGKKAKGSKKKGKGKKKGSKKKGKKKKKSKKKSKS